MFYVRGPDFLARISCAQHTKAEHKDDFKVHFQGPAPVRGGRRNLFLEFGLRGIDRGRAVACIGDRGGLCVDRRGAGDSVLNDYA